MKHIWQVIKTQGIIDNTESAIIYSFNRSNGHSVFHFMAAGHGCGMTATIQNQALHIDS
jgi:hypothetical protein